MAKYLPKTETAEIFRKLTTKRENKVKIMQPRKGNR